MPDYPGAGGDQVHAGSKLVLRRPVLELCQPMSPFRLIASDLDGTLLRDDGTISTRTRKAIRAAERAGFIFAFVTARPPRNIRSLAFSAGLTGVAVCSNGAVLYDIGGRATLQRVALAPAIARELVATLRALLPEIAFAAEHDNGVTYDLHFPGLLDDASARVPNIERSLSNGLVKLLLHHPNQEMNALVSAVSSAVKGLGEVLHSGVPDFIEISACGVSKGSGLDKLCSSLNVVASEVIAFGDMPNDLPMLRFAGRAIAVSNAHPEVLACADEVTASNNEDGVAQTIEALLG